MCVKERKGNERKEGSKEKERKNSKEKRKKERKKGNGSPVKLSMGTVRFLWFTKAAVLT